jgi:hypothetical protein
LKAKRVLRPYREAERYGQLCSVVSLRSILPHDRKEYGSLGGGVGFHFSVERDRQIDRETER